MKKLATTVSMVVIAVLTSCTLNMSCASGQKEVQAAGSAMLDCAKADLPGIGALLIQLAKTAVDFVVAKTPIDLAALAAQALANGSAVGTCAWAEFKTTLAKLPTITPATSLHTSMQVTPPTTTGSYDAELAGMCARAGITQVKTLSGPVVSCP